MQILRLADFIFCQYSWPVWMLWTAVLILQPGRTLTSAWPQSTCTESSCIVLWNNHYLMVCNYHVQGHMGQVVNTNLWEMGWLANNYYFSASPGYFCLSKAIKMLWWLCMENWDWDLWDLIKILQDHYQTLEESMFDHVPSATKPNYKFSPQVFNVILIALVGRNCVNIKRIYLCGPVGLIKYWH